MGQISKTKEGAASFYMVAISTLILVIIAASFAAVVISELARTSNNDLAQSAYDSAMAGVEDAKLAYSNYLNCMENSGTAECAKIIEYAREGSCDSVANILKREIGDKGVTVSEYKDSDNNMEQSYTCAILKLNPSEYITTISGSNPTKVVPVKLEETSPDDINAVKVKWKAKQDDQELNYSNYDGSKVVFPAVSEGNGQEQAVPPTIGVGLVQTASVFKFSDFDMTKDGRTNRGMVYLVPSDGASVKQDGQDANYVVGYNEEKGINYISEDALLKSNNKTVQNLPYVVNCSGGSEESVGSDGDYTCAATIELPRPIQSEGAEDIRNDNTFEIIITVPSQGAPEIEASLEFCKDMECKGEVVIDDEGGTTTTRIGEKLGMQVVVDVTGRANDLYRRIETRLEAPGSGSAEVTSYALQAMNGIEKIQSVNCEANFAGETKSNCK